MSFLADFVHELMTDVALALQLPGGAVYLGRDRQRVPRQGLEVWVRPEGFEPQATTRLHTLEVHVRFRAKREGNLTGAAQFGAVLDALVLLRDRYDGLRPFATALPTLVALEADGGPLDFDPDDQDVLDGTLRLKALERLP